MHATAVPITLGPAHELLVPVTIDGTPLVFQLDTGASTTTITPTTRDRVHAQTGVVGVAGDGAAGRIPHVDRAGLGSVAVAGLELRGLHAAVIALDTPGVDGLLGMDVFRFVTTEIDLAQRRFVVHPETGWRTPDLVEVPYTPLDGGQIAIAVTLDGRPATAILDVGANQSFANPLAMPGTDRAAREVDATVGADAHRSHFRAFDDVALDVGGVSLVASSLLVADLPIFARLGLRDRPAVIIGADLLAARRVVIEGRRHRVYLSSRGP